MLNVYDGILIGVFGMFCLVVLVACMVLVTKYPQPGWTLPPRSRPNPIGHDAARNGCVDENDPPAGSSSATHRPPDPINVTLRELK